MNHPIPQLLKDRRGSSAAEFALVLPLLLIFLIGLIDAGRFMWTMNRVEKATQMGARFAVATDMVPSSLAGHSFATGSELVTQGDPVPKADFGGASCVWAGGSVICSCDAGETCPTLTAGTPAETQAFERVVDRMKRFLPELQYDQVRIDYAYSGLGFSGDPNGSDVAPLVRVSIRPEVNTPLTFRPALLLGFSIPYPAFTASLTLEDGVGNFAN